MTIHCSLQQELSWLLAIKVQLIESLPSIVDSVRNRELRQVLRCHISETRYQKDQLQYLSKLSNCDARETDCVPVQALVFDLCDLICIQPASSTRDLLLINKLRLIKNYEANSYHKAYQYAHLLSYTLLSNHLCKAKQKEKSIELKLAAIVMTEFVNLTRLYQII